MDTQFKPARAVPILLLLLAAFALPASAWGEAGCATDTLGNATYSGTASGYSRGNSFYCATTNLVTKIEYYLSPSASTELRFFIYESTTQTGTYTKIHETVVPSSGTGEGWYSSGPISVQLSAGRYYIIGTAWQGACTYYYGGFHPISTSFGSSLNGYYLSTYPPPATTAATTSSNAYYQRITTCQATRLLTVTQPNGGEWYEPGRIVQINWAASGSIWVTGDRVSIQRSADGGTTWAPISGAESLPYNAGSFSWDTTGLARSDQYKIKVTFTGDSAVNDTSDAGFTIAMDVTPPVITHTPLEDTGIRAGPYAVCATVTDHSGLDAVSLYWKRNEGFFAAVAMTPSGNPNQYCASIPGPSVAGDRYCYYIEATDGSRAHNVGRNPSGAPGSLDCFSITPCISETIGNPATYGTSGSFTRGNVYSCTSPALLTEIQHYLDPSVSTEMRFFVYQSASLSGTYNKIYEKVSPSSGTGPGWYGSGPIAVRLMAGQYYIIGTAWQQSATYYYDTSGHPITTSFGQSQSGYALSTYPPPTTATNPSSGSVYYQRITTCPIGRLITLTQPNGGEWYEPGNNVPIEWSVFGGEWTSNDEIGLECSDDGGNSWAAILGAENLPYNAGSFDWDTSPYSESDHYKVRAVFNGDPTVNDVSDAEFALAPDTAPPVITHTPLTDVGDRYGPYRVCATVTDNHGIGSVTLHWQKNGGAFSSVTMNPSGTANEFCADIPGPSAVGDRYCYYIEARDSSVAGNIAKSPASAPSALDCFSIASQIQVLSYIQYSDVSGTGEYQNTLAAIRTATTAFGNTELTDYNGLAAALTGKEVLLIPEQENGTLSQMQTIGASWASALSSFLARGGRIVVCDYGGGSYGILSGAGLMSVTGSTSITGAQLWVTDPSSPLVIGVATPYTAGNGTDSFTTTETCGVIKTWNGNAPVVLSKQFGPGVVTLIGHDYYTSNASQDRLIGNAVFESFAARRLVLAQPNGGEWYEPGTTIPIRWYTYGVEWVGTDAVKIEYSSNGGTTWSPVPGAQNLPHDGTFDWNTTGMAGSSLYRVRVVYNSDSSVSDASDANFSIAVDTTLPVITHTPLTDTGSRTGPYTVCATVTDNLGIGSVTLYWKKNGGAFTSVTMTLSGTANQYCANIPGPSVPGDIYCYYIQAQDSSAARNATRHPTGAPDTLNCFTITSCIADTIGSTTYSASGTGYSRGNVYLCTSNRFITQIEHYLNPSSSTEMRFFIYESTSLNGTYNKIYEATAPTSGTGAGWYGSGPISAQLTAGRYYIIGTAWQGPATYYYGGAHPVTTAFGTSQSGYNSSTYPPPATTTNPSPAAVYYQRITSCPISRLLTLTEPNGGHWYEAGNTIPIRWTSIGDEWLSTDTVLIQQSSDGGSTWGAIIGAENLPYNGSFDWNTTGVAQSDTYKVRVVLNGNSSIYDASDANFIIQTDITPPAIVHTPLTDTGARAGPYQVCAMVTDDLGVGAVTLYWQKNGGAFTPVAMTPSGVANQYCGDIPGPSSLGDRYCYHIAAQDTAHTPNTALQPSSGDYCFTIAGAVIEVSPASMSFDLPPGGHAGADMTIYNRGSLNLHYVCSERPGSSPTGRGIMQPEVSIPHEVDWARDHAPGRLIVRMKPGLTAAGRSTLHQQLGTRVLQSYSLIPADVVQVPDGADLRAVAEAYASLPQVAYAEPDYIWTADSMPNDPSFLQLWGMHNIGQSGGTVDADIDAPEAWELSTGDHQVIVGVIDTGIDYNHPDLAANVWTNPGEIPGNGLDDDHNGYIDDVHGYDFANRDGDPYDDHGHGTHVSGTIGGVGNNGIGVAGVNWSVRIMALKFLSASGSGYTSDAVSCLEYAVLMHANLTSNSWGGGGYDQALSDAIAAAGAAGQLFVAAAGNDGANNDTVPHYPSNYPLDNIISVAASDRNDALAYFSNYGPTSVDLAAPGVDVYSSLPGNNYGLLSGTSMATPHVAGACALCLSVSPGASPAQVKSWILGGVDPKPAFTGKMVSGGRLNLRNSILAAGIPWLSENPMSGDIAPGTSATVSVNADATGLADGFSETGRLEVLSNDPDYRSVEVPVTLTVTEYVHIAHTPLAGLTEDTVGPYLVNASITATHGLDTTSPRVFWKAGAGSFNEVAMVHTSGSSYVGEIPGQPSGTTISYYISAQDTGGRSSANPLGAPASTYDFRVITDATPPVITHTPLAETGNRTGPYPVCATVTDNFGLASVTLHWQKDGGTFTSVTMTHSANPDEYCASLPGPSVAGDRYCYYIEAQDASRAGNVARNPSGAPGALNCFAITSCVTDVVGAPATSTAAAATRGNVFSCTAGTTLSQIEQYLNPSATSELRYVVYESTTSGGTYGKVFEKVTPSSGTGLGWYGSGPISVPLTAGHYYIIGAAWASNATYYYATSGHPVTTAFGQSISGYLSSVYPPPVATSNPNSSSVYYQRLTSCQIRRFLTIVQPNGGEWFEPGNTIRIRWTAAGTDWQPANTVRLEYSTNSGATWSAIPGAESLPYDGAFDWHTTGVAETDQYRVRVVFNDDSAVSDASDANFTIRADTSPAVISHSPLNDTGDTAGPYTVCATVTDNFGVSAVTLYWSRNESAFTSAAMTPSGTANEYCADIPGPSAMGDRLCYYIEAVDSSAAHNVTRNPSMAPGTLNCFAVKMCPTEVIGSGSTYATMGSSAFRGNTYHCATDATIAEIQQYLYLSIVGPLSYSVYESSTVDGVFTKIYERTVANPGKGTKWYTSGAISVPMVAGRYYIIGVGWQSNAQYYMDFTGHPITTSFGESLSSCSFIGYPPPDTILASPSANVIYQKLTTCQFGRTLRVTRPNGGEWYEPGTNVPIRWGSFGFGWVHGDTVRIEYSSNGGSTWSPLAGAESLPYDGSFDWNTAGAAESAQYKVRVVFNGDAAVNDVSDANFTIKGDTAPPVITHMSLANTSDKAGPYRVCATVIDNVGVRTVTLHWRKNGNVFTSVPMLATGNPNEYGVEIPGPSESGDSYCYYIEAEDSSAAGNIARHPSGAPGSLNCFTITTCTTDVIGTMGGSTDGIGYARGNIFSCTSSVMLSSFDMYLNPAASTELRFFVYEAMALNGTYKKIMEAVIPNSGSGANWYSSGPIAATLAAGRFYIIGAAWQGNTTFYYAPSGHPTFTAFGQSENGYSSTIYPPPASTAYMSGAAVYYQRMTTCPIARLLSIDHPNGGEVHEPGNTVPIRWSATGLNWQSANTVSLQYSNDGGSTWNPIAGAQSLPYNGSFDWNTAGVAPTNQCRVKVIYNGDTSIGDTSDGDFTFSFDTASPEITHTPLGNTGDKTGPYEVRAIVTDDRGLSSVKLYWRKNGGSFNQVTMTPTSTVSEYSGNITGPSNTGDVYCYYIEAKDASIAGHTTVSPVGAPGTLDCFSIATCATTSIGHSSQSSQATGFSVGNVFACTTAGVLSEFKHNLYIPAPTELRFFVYESTSLNGTYTKIYETAKGFGTGAGDCSSGPISVSLLPGRFYIIGVAGQGNNTYYYSFGGHPYATVFGQSVGGYSSTTYPPPATTTYTSDTTAQYQTITACQAVRMLTITQPNGGEWYEPGDTAPIRWNPSGSGWFGTDAVKLDYSSNGGATWNPITGAQNLPYNGSFDWNTTGMAGSDLCEVRATFNGDATVNDASDAVFTMRADTTPPVITHTPLTETANRTGPYTVLATVTDNHGIGSVTLYWQRNSGTLTSVTMSPTGTANQYYADIPGPSVANDGYCYYIEARDSSRAGNISRNPAGAPGVKNCFTVIGCSTSPIGNANFSVPNVAICRGNVYACSADTVLSQIEHYLYVPTSTEMRFFVYESATSSGTYSKIFEQVLPSSGIGLGWYSSAPIAVPLLSGHYYIIGTAWRDSATYYYASSGHPVQTPFGHTVGGYLSSVYPPAAIATNTNRPGIYYQRIKTCTPARSIAESKRSEDGIAVMLSSKLVSAVFSGRFYVQGQDRSSGMGALFSGTMPAVGDTVIVAGDMTTLTDERLVDRTFVKVTATGTPLVPLGLINKHIGGGDFFYQVGPPSTGQKGVTGQRDLSNFGLLITTYGTVTASGADYFYIDDGGSIEDYSGNVGIRVLCPGLSQPSVGKYVVVTGISSVLSSGGEVFRSIRPRVQSDIQVVPGT